MPACTTSGPETRYNVALAQRKERCVTDERRWLCAINSFTNAGVLVQEMNATPFIPNSTTYLDEFCVRPETAKLTTLKQTARVQIAFMFTVTLRMFASDPKLTANASLYLYLSDQAPPPVLLPGPQGAPLTRIGRLGSISHAAHKAQQEGVHTLDTFAWGETSIICPWRQFQSTSKAKVLLYP